MQLNFSFCVELFGLLKYVHEFSVFVEILISNSVYLAILTDIKYCYTNQKQLTRILYQLYLLLVVCTELPFVLWLRLTFDRIVQISL